MEPAQPPSAPRVLLATAQEWMSTARLAMALKSFGCHVDLLAPSTHPARVTGVFDHIFTYQPLWPLRNLEHALRQSLPDAIIPADELTMSHLDELADGKTPFAQSVRDLLRRSLGSEAGRIASTSRMQLLTLAQEEGIATPQTLLIEKSEDLQVALERFGLPLVLKADGSSGGQGVRVVRDPEKLEAEWQALYRPPGFVRVLKRALVDRDRTHILPWLRRQTRAVTAQKFVVGVDRTGMAVASEGRMLGCVTLEVVRYMFTRGASSVVQVVDDPMISAAMGRMIERLGWSGFCGFDFMVEPLTGNTLLIEMNSRPTQLSYLPLGPGKDLAASYVREVLGFNVADRKAATQRSMIAMFPQELLRDPESDLLEEAYHDVPWQSPQLVEAALERGPMGIRVEDRRASREDQWDGPERRK